MADMVEVVIDSIRVSLMSQQRIVILRERDHDRYLAIWIGVYEAESITIALQEVEVARPLTHDLLMNIIRQLGGRVLRVEVSALRDDTFFGSIVVEANGQSLHIDARPSDALAVAVRAHVPVLVDRAVMNSAGITPEEDMQDNHAAEAQTDAPDARPSAQDAPADDLPADEADDRLSIFSDFLNQLDGDTDEEQPGPDDAPHT